MTVRAEKAKEQDAEMKTVTRGGLCILAVVGGFLVLVEAGLHTEENVCGEKTCLAREYCHVQLNMCQPCKEVCEKSNHNYQQDTCSSQCQDYLHERLFVTRPEEAAEEDLRSVVARLTVLVTATIVLSVLILLLLAVTLALFFWYRKQHHKQSMCQLWSRGVVARLTVLVTATIVLSVLILLLLAVTLALFFWYRKQHHKQSMLHIKSNGTDNGKVNYKTETLKLDMSAAVPPPSTTTAPPPVTPATTSTPLSTRPRYPKEDPTLEYGAYDNPALTPSPVFDNKPPESTPVSRRQESSF